MANNEEQELTSDITLLRKGGGLREQEKKGLMAKRVNSSTLETLIFTKCKCSIFSQQTYVEPTVCTKNININRHGSCPRDFMVSVGEAKTSTNAHNEVEQMLLPTVAVQVDRRTKR